MFISLPSTSSFSVIVPGQSQNAYFNQLLGEVAELVAQAESILNGLTAAQLKTVAKSFGLKRYSSLNKADLLERCLGAYKSSAHMIAEDLADEAVEVPAATPAAATGYGLATSPALVSTLEAANASLAESMAKALAANEAFEATFTEMQEWWLSYKG